MSFDPDLAPDDESLLYRFTPDGEANVTGVDELAEEYAIVRNLRAQSGLIVYGRIGENWVANVSARPVIRQLLIESQRWTTPRRFKCSGCGEIVESLYDVGGERHRVPQTAACSGVTSLYEVKA